MPMASLSSNQQHVLTGLNVFATAMSFVGSAGILTCFVAYPSLRKFSFKLIAYLSLADVLNCMSGFMGDPPSPSAVCTLQGVTNQFFATASYLWTTVIAFVLHRTVVQHNADVQALERHFHAFVWCTAFVMTLLPLAMGEVGDAGPWCWIRSSTEAGRVLRMVTFYVPLWVAIAYNGYVYYLVVRAIRYAMQLAESSQLGGKLNVEQLKALQRLGFYPLILVGAHLFATINRIQNWVAPDDPVFWLYALQAFTQNANGFFNFLAYGFNKTVRRALATTFRERCPQCTALCPCGQQRRGLSEFVEMADMEGDVSSPTGAGGDAAL